MLSCASQSPPAGGPPDRTPPVVAGTWPSSDETGVPPGRPIRVRFSEGMDRRSVESSFFLAPAPAGGVRFRWRGEAVEATLPGGLAPGRTYLISVGAGSRDEAGNPLRASYDFAFSTGDRIDRGEIRGRVSRMEERPDQVYVLTYSLREAGGDPDPRSTPPDYTTQTAEDGTYRFPRLAAGRYRVFAFSDRDRDRTWSPGVDPLAVPPADVLLTASDVRARVGDLRPSLPDSGRATLLSARAPDRNHVSLRFDRPVRTPLSAQIVGPSGDLPIRAVHLDPGDSSRALLLTDDQTPDAAYRVLSSEGPLTVDAPEKAVAFRGVALSDRTPPRVAAIRPQSGAENVPTGQALEIIFSEPMKPADLGPAWVASDSTEAPAGAFSWETRDRLRFHPAAPWRAGREYRLRGDARSLADEAGNRLSGDLTFAFTALDTSRLGSISGDASPQEGLPSARVHLRAERVGDRDQEFRTSLPGPGHFVIADLSPGRYAVEAFLDVNGDGRWTAGRAVPFLPAEPAVRLPDPVTVRPRWAAEGVEVRIESVQYLKDSGQ